VAKVNSAGYAASTGYVYSKEEVWPRTRAALDTPEQAAAADMPCVKVVAEQLASETGLSSRGSPTRSR